MMNESKAKADKSYISSSTSQSIPTHHKTKQKHSILSKLGQTQFQADIKKPAWPTSRNFSLPGLHPKTSQLALLASS
jgi:hypothetical protein